MLQAHYDSQSQTHAERYKGLRSTSQQERTTSSRQQAPAYRQGSQAASRRHSSPVPAQIAASPYIAAQRSQIDNNFGPAIQPKTKNQTGLPDNLKSGVESLSGMSMDAVRVHYNSDQPAQLNAHAYAQGTDIHIAPGQEKHLPHEAWHVVQQAQGRVRPTMQMKSGVPINDDKGLEHEATLIGAKARDGGHAPLLPAALDEIAPVQRVAVAQLGAKYDLVKNAADADIDGGDYNFTSVAGKAIVVAGEEMVAEHLAGQKYTARDNKELAQPSVMLSSGYGGAEGVLLVPGREKSALDIYTGEFVPNLMHELGHMVTGKEGDTTVKEDIPALAKKAGVEAAKIEHAAAHPNAEDWIEELRADLTGIFLRVAKGTVPTKEDYGQLRDEPPDGQHPPGSFRLEVMGELMTKLGKHW
jgi:hypothetical protein